LDDKKALLNNLLSHEQILDLLEGYMDQLDLNARREDFLVNANRPTNDKTLHPHGDRHMDLNMYSGGRDSTGVASAQNFINKTGNARPLTATTTTALARPFTGQTEKMTIHNYSTKNIRTNSRIRYGRIKYGPVHGPSN
jgi:hypothetical protein